MAENSAFLQEHGKKIAGLIIEQWNMYTASQELTKDAEMLLKNSRKIGEIFQDYFEIDVQGAIEKIWKFGNKKTRPTFQQILADLRGEEKFLLTKPKKPTTRLFAIANEFDEVVKRGHQEGVWYSEYWDKERGISFGNKACVRNGKPRSKLWDWEDAVKAAQSARPDVFAKFQNLNFAEKCAITLQLNMLPLSFEEDEIRIGPRFVGAVGGSAAAAAQKAIREMCR